MQIHCIFVLIAFAELAEGNLSQHFLTSGNISWKDRLDFALQLAKGKHTASRSIFFPLI
jgi:hypothetical protein